MRSFVREIFLVLLLGGAVYYYVGYYPGQLARKHVEALEAEQDAGSKSAPATEPEGLVTPEDLRRTPAAQNSSEQEEPAAPPPNSPSEPAAQPDPGAEANGWTDAQLGLDFDRPWREVPFAELVLVEEEQTAAVAELLKNKKALQERKARLWKRFDKDKEYWEARFGLQLIDKQIKALQDPSSKFEKGLSQALAESYMKYWVFRHAGYLVESPTRPAPIEGFRTQELLLLHKMAFAQTPLGAYPHYEDWFAFPSERAPKGNPDHFDGLPESLRLAMLADYRFARPYQLASIPSHPKH